MHVPMKAKSYEEGDVLKLIRVEGPLSRKEIARHLGVSLATVTHRVTELLALGVVREIASEGTGKGRKPSLIEYNRDSGYVIGVDVGGKYIRTALSNMLGEIVTKTEVPTLAYRGTRCVIDRVMHTIDEVVKGCGISPHRILGVGLGLPGIVAEHREDGLVSPFLDDATAVELVTNLTDKYNVPIRVENDVNMAVIGEKWKGAATGYKDIVYVNLGLGFACGIIVGGELYRGARGAAGEVGFMVLEKQHMRDSFCARGVLEELIAGHGIVTAMLERLDEQGIDADTVFPVERDAEAVFAEAANGNADAQAIVEKTITYFAMALTNIIAVLDPEIVVIGGGIGSALADSTQQIQAILECHIPRPPKIVPSALGSIAGVYGAVAVALRAGRSSINV